MEADSRDYEAAIRRIEGAAPRLREEMERLRGNRARGENHGHAKFTNGEVRALREKLDSGEISVRLAKEIFGVSENTIYNIWRRRTYVDVEG